MRAIVRPVLLSLLVAASVAVAADAPPSRPPVARVDNVTETHFGTPVVDPYRWMETDGQELKDFFAGQNAYTRAQLARLQAPHDKLLARIRELQNGVPLVRFISRAGNRYFFLAMPLGGNDARLMTRAVSGGESRVLIDPAQFAQGDVHAAIGYYSDSPDGSHVVAGICLGGGEDCTLRIVSVADGKLLPDAVSGPLGWNIAWQPDGKGFYYARLQDLPADAPPTRKYENIRVHRHTLGTDQSRDVAVFGPGVAGSPKLPIAGFPDFKAARDGSVLLAEYSRGTIATSDFWVRDAGDDKSPWRQVAKVDDEVRGFALRGAQAYVITTRGAPNGRVVTFDTRKQTLADARELLPASDAIILSTDAGLSITQDGLYVVGHRDGRSLIKRLPWDGGKLEDIALPADGVCNEFTGDEAVAGITFDVDGPARAPTIYRYDPKTARTVDTGLRQRDPADYSNITVTRGEAPSTGGAMVPVTIIGRRDVPRDGNNPTLMIAYGSYGFAIPMMFTAPNLAWYERGGLIAYAHVRGGGEKGRAWHEAGRGKNKQHNIDDFIAVAQWLVKAKYTSPSRLAVAGKSAGGIPVGGIVTQRPELIRAAIFRVGVTDMLSLERSSGGDANVPEYGSIRKEDEFRALLGYSAYANVRPGTKYPAIMLETGINDPRVPPWQLAKMTARLQAANASDKPIMLRVDYDAGHGVGLDKKQVAALMADEFTFLGWQLGMDGFAPAEPDAAP